MCIDGEGITQCLLCYCNVHVHVHVYHPLQDNCKETYNPQQKDEDNDGVGDACDNCKYGPNPKQENNDGDDTGDICDTDDDNDGVG